MSNDKEKAIKAVIDAGRTDEARRLLGPELKAKPSAEICYLASRVALNEPDRRKFLQGALRRDPHHVQAQKALEQMDHAGMAPAASPPEPARPQPVPTTATPPQAPALARPVPATAARPVATPTPAPAAPVPPGEGKKYIVGHLTAPSALYLLPHRKADMRTQMPAGSGLVVVSRMPDGNWLNVLYQGTIGQPMAGWVPASFVSGLRLGDRPVNPLDLPLTDHQLDRKEDVQALYGRLSTHATLFIVGGMLGLFLGFILIFGSPFLGGLLLFASVALFVAGIILSFRNNLNYWNKLRRSKQGKTENMKEDLLKLAVLAGTVAVGAKAMKNSHERNVARINSRRDVTIRHRR